METKENVLPGQRRSIKIGAFPFITNPKISEPNSKKSHQKHEGISEGGLKNGQY